MAAFGTPRSTDGSITSGTSDGDNSEAETLPAIVSLPESSNYGDRSQHKAAYLARLGRARDFNKSRRSSGGSEAHKSSLLGRESSDSSLPIDVCNPYMPREKTSLRTSSANSVISLATPQPKSPGGVRPVLEVSAHAGAVQSGSHSLRHAWSSRAGLLAITNGRSELLVFDIAQPDAPSVVMQLPDAEVPFMSWDPSTEMYLAVLMRGHGIGLLKAGSPEPMKLWVGVQKGRKTKQFDPICARWSKAGQLIIGLGDGSFAIWDAPTSNVFTSVQSKSHRNPVTCGDWFYHATFNSPVPCLSLVLASESKIMVTYDVCSRTPQTKELVLELTPEGEGPALDLGSLRFKKRVSRVKRAGKALNKKLMQRRSFKAPTSLVGLQFDQVLFSPSGAFLVVLGNYARNAESKLVISYTTIATRSKGDAARGVSVRSGRGLCATSEMGTPKDVCWASDYEVLIAVHARDGGSLQKLSAISQYQADDCCFPAFGAPSPGQLVASAASTLTLEQPPVIAAAYVTSEAHGLLIVLDFDLEELARFPLDAPPLSLQLPSTATEVSLCFEGGGCKVLEIPEAPPADTIELRT